MRVANNGARRWPVVCVYCEETYIHTNRGNRRWQYGWNFDAGSPEDVHLVNCKKRPGGKPKEIEGWKYKRREYERRMRRAYPQGV